MLSRELGDERPDPCEAAWLHLETVLPVAVRMHEELRGCLGRSRQALDYRAGVGDGLSVML